MLKALAHSRDEEEQEVNSGRRSKQAAAPPAVCADPAAIKAARMRQGLLVLVVSIEQHMLLLLPLLANPTDCQQTCKEFGRIAVCNRPAWALIEIPLL